MPAVTFDTLKFVKTLKEAGVSEPQAEAFSKAVQESHETADLATKGDIAELRKDMDVRFAGMGAKLEKLELRMTIKLGSIVIAGVGVLTLIFKLL